MAILEMAEKIMWRAVCSVKRMDKHISEELLDKKVKTNNVG